MEYHDFAEPEAREQNPVMLEAIRVQNWSLPVVALNGEVLSHGYISFWDITEAIEAKSRKA